jgi:hypothetical protein
MTTLGTVLPGIAQSLLQGFVAAPVSAATAEPVRIKVQTPSGAPNSDRDNSLMQCNPATSSGESIHDSP